MLLPHGDVNVAVLFHRTGRGGPCPSFGYSGVSLRMWYEGAFVFNLRGISLKPMTGLKGMGSVNGSNGQAARWQRL